MPRNTFRKEICVKNVSGDIQITEAMVFVIDT